MKSNIKLYCSICSSFKFKKGVTNENIFSILNLFDICQYTNVSTNGAIDRYIKQKEDEDVSKETIGTYKTSLKIFSKFIKLNKLDSVTKDTIKSYINYLVNTRHLKASSINLYINILKTFFQWCENENIIDHTPCKGINYKYTYNFKHAIPKSDMNKLIMSCNNIRDRALLNFLLYSGCRVSEVINIKVNDIDWARNEIEVTGKGNKNRIVLINKTTKKLLKLNLKHSKNKEGYLFSSNKHPFKNLTRFSVNAIIKSIGNRAEVYDVSPHTFRHCFGTYALERGMDITSIQKLLGHENISTTQLYAESNLSSIKNQYQKCFN